MMLNFTAFLAVRFPRLFLFLFEAPTPC